MRRTNSTLMNSKPPSVQQRCNKMNTRHNHMGRISTCRDIRHNVPVSQSFYVGITTPSISVDFNSLLHVVHYKFIKARRRYIWNDRHAYSARATPANFCSDCNNGLSLSATTANFHPNTSDVGFINFSSARQLISSGAYHRATQLMEPSPCSIITAKTKNPLQSKSTLSMFLTRYKPHGEKPCSKGFVSSMKQRSRSNGRLPFTLPAKIETTPRQRRILTLKSTTWANETIRPSNFRNVVNASIFAAKPFIKLLECSRIISTGNGVLWLAHNRRLDLVGS